MINQELVKIFQEMADLKEALGENRFKIIAYQKVAQNLTYVSEDIAAIYKRGGIKELEKIEGVGHAIAGHIEEYIKKGKVTEWSDMRRRVAPAVVALMSIPGIGPKTALKVANNLKIRGIDDLKKELTKNRKKVLKKLAEVGLKEKSLDNILRGIEILGKQEGRLPLFEASLIVDDISDYLKKAPDLEKFDAVGSFRRQKETVGDIDFIGASKNIAAVLDYSVKGPFVDKVLLKGATKASVIHISGRRVDFEILESKKYGSLLQHLTGSKEHNIVLRTHAVSKGFSVSEHGIKHKDKLITCETEECVYKTLGMDFIPPELREGRGEVEAALKHKLPTLIEQNDIKGDLQIHTNWSDGHDTVFDMAKAAQNMGYEYVALTDHSIGLGITGGLDEKRFHSRQKEIAKAQNKLKIKIFSGVEVNIKANGQLDLPDNLLKQFDFVLAAVHSSFSQDKATMTQRIIGAIENPYVTAIAHPTGRLIEKRPSYDADWPAIFKAAAWHKKTLEIDAFPERLDLPDYLVKQAKNYGVKFTIGTDSHSIEHLKYMRYGTAIARRGWLTKMDVINTMDLKELLAWFKKPLV